MFNIEEIGPDNLEYSKGLNYKKNQREKTKIKFRNKAIIKIAAGVVLVGGLSALLMDSNKPVNIVATEMVSDAGLYKTDDGKKIDGKMTREELLEYIETHDLSSDEIEKAVRKFLKQEMVANIDNALEKIDNNNPGILELEEENNKSIGR